MGCFAAAGSEPVPACWPLPRCSISENTAAGVVNAAEVVAVAFVADGTETFRSGSTPQIRRWRLRASTDIAVEIAEEGNMVGRGHWSARRRVSLSCCSEDFVERAVGSLIADRSARNRRAGRIAADYPALGRRMVCRRYSRAAATRLHRRWCDRSFQWSLAGHWDHSADLDRVPPTSCRIGPRVLANASSVRISSAIEKRAIGVKRCACGEIRMPDGRAVKSISHRHRCGQPAHQLPPFSRPASRGHRIRLRSSPVSRGGGADATSSEVTSFRAEPFNRAASCWAMSLKALAVADCETWRFGLRHGCRNGDDIG